MDESMLEYWAEESAREDMDTEYDELLI